jgi:hypothetical protein
MIELPIGLLYILCFGFWNFFAFGMSALFYKGHKENPSDESYTVAYLLFIFFAIALDLIATTALGIVVWV